MPGNQEELDTLNRSSRDSSSAMMQSLYDAVVAASQEQRGKDELTAAQRKEHFKKLVRDNRYKEDLDRLNVLTKDVKRTLSAMDSIATILFAIGSQAEALTAVLKYLIEEDLRGRGKNGYSLNVREHISTIASMLFKQITQAVQGKMTDPDVYLPGVIHFVELTDDFKIKKAPLRFDANIVVTDAQEELFNRDFKKWLLKNEYEENPKTGQVTHKETNAIITKEAFEALRDDPVHGLTRYFKDEWQMKNVKQERARVEAPKEELPPKKENSRKRDRDDTLDQDEVPAPRPR